MNIEITDDSVYQCIRLGDMNLKERAKAIRNAKADLRLLNTKL